MFGIKYQTQEISTGITQESDLEALLFLWYINDVPRETDIILFAGDTRLSQCRKKLNSLENRINNQ